ncbi:malate dehydrogenase, partial [Halobacteriales archaeon QH_9_66_26]
ATQWGPATGVGHVVESIVRDTGTVLPGSLVLDGEYGHDDVGLGVPMKLTSDGAEVVDWGLSEYEREQLGQAADKLADQYETIS